MKHHRKGIRATAVGVVLVLLSACAPSRGTEQAGPPSSAPTPAQQQAAPAEKTRRTLIVADYTKIRFLDPAKTVQATDVMLARNMFSGLVRYKPNSSDQFEGDLAERWDVAPDGKTYTFYLRKNAFFHNGDPVTAEDVKFSFERVADAKTASSYRAEVAGWQSEVLDAHTFRLKLGTPQPGILHKLTGVRQGAIVPKKYVESVGSDGFAKKPVGSGPYKLVEWLPEKITLDVHDRYHFGPPPISKVTYVYVPDLDASVLALEKGELDLMRTIPREPAVLERLKKNPQVQLKPINHLAWMMLHMNVKVKPFDDVRLRRAIAHALNKREIVELAYGGLGEPLDSLVPKGFFGHTEEGIPRYDYNPEKARRLLGEAGYPNGLKLKLDNMTSPNYQALGVVLKDQLAKVGIQLDLDVTDQTAWQAKITGGKTAFTLYLPARSPDPDIPLTQFWHSKSFPPGLNVSRYDKLDGMIETARREMDEAKRRQTYVEIQKRLMEDLPSIPIAMVHFGALYRTGLKGVPDSDPIWGFDFGRMSWK